MAHTAPSKPPQAAPSKLPKAARSEAKPSEGGPPRRRAKPSEDRPSLALRGVSKSFGPRRVLSGVDFELGADECVAIVGFSGSGKTTLISILAGLLAPDAGRVEMDGAPAPPAGPERGVVFQRYGLLPWLSVTANVQLAVDVAHPELRRRERRQRALEFVRLVGLAPAADKRPRELSGGMRQRVAVARALATEPRILLLDEPLGALDALTRGSLQQEIARLLQHSGRAAVLVTNDVDEAILLADRIVPLTPGPDATLGASFRVSLERPRDRALLNRDPAFKKLRNEVTSHLLELAARRAGGGGRAPVRPLPDLAPAPLSRLRGGGPR